MRKRSRPSFLLPIALVLVALVLVPVVAQDRPESLLAFDDALITGPAEDIEAPALEGEEPAEPGGALYLSDRPWTLATSGWVAIGNDPTPKRDLTFQEQGISLGGRPYAKGIGTFPFSEIIMELDGRATYFRASIGIDDKVSTAQGSVRFLVFVDDALVAQSSVLRAGERPRHLQAPVAGGQRLRLVVTDADDGTTGDFAVWAGARLVTTAPEEWERARRVLAGQVQRTQELRAAAALAWRSAEQQRADADLRALTAALGSGGKAGTARGALDPASQRLVLANDRAAVFLGFGGEQHGMLTIVRLPSGEPVVAKLAPTLLSDGAALNLHRDTVPQDDRAYRVHRVTDPALGESLEAEAHYRLREGAAEDVVTVRLRLAEASPALVYQIDMPDGVAQPGPRAVRYLDQDQGALMAVAGHARYLTDYSHLREGTITDDSQWRRDAVGLGKPLVVWSSDTGRGLLLAVLDEVDLPAGLLFRRELGSPIAAVSLEQPLLERAAAHVPRLYLEALDTPELKDAFGNYRQVIGRLYPAPPVPSWVKYQWLSWYVYNTDISDTEIKRQIDFIAENLADLGPWNVLVDAGWYISEGREGADWRAVDREKFPFGLEDLVDYAHQRGVRVVLYFSSPFLDDNASPRNWLGLRGIIDEHPDWLIPLEPDGEVRRYVYNYQNPELREYMAEVMRDFFVRYGVDGIKLDGLGGGEGQVIDKLFFGSFGQEQEFLGQTMEIYRFTHQAIADLGIADFFIESGWVMPAFAHRYAHVFRYGDEAPVFSSPYPFPGLQGHVDYGLFQRLIGQYGNIGALYMDPDENSLARSWLEASLALGLPVTLGFDLPSVDPETLSALRERLVHFTAFREGVTRLGPGWLPETFSTTVDGTTYLGILNRGPEPKEYRIRLRDYGLDARQNHLVYVVGRKRFVMVRDRLVVRQPGNSFRLLVLRSAPGVMWTNSSFEVAHQEPQRLAVTVQGPAAIDGFLTLYVPRPREVWLDGRMLEAGPGLGAFQYDTRTQALTITYPHDQPHTIEVVYGTRRGGR
ncbi:MAG: NPCBM/NEW2 domain-containing protein [Chloroflexi bacterium]|nr:NPCBM/NEW2 domain-containing protein [Chloroflexota bacterium]